MCRLFGMSAGAEPAKATFWLLDAPDSLSLQSHREPDGTGLGWFDDDEEPRISKQPIAAYGDAEFARHAREIASKTFVAHVRYATTGALQLENTHPFEQQGRLFAHNGVIGDLPALDAHLGAALGLVKGETDSERFFALITREIAERDGQVEQGIVAACAWVAANLPLISLNFVLATADGLWALRYPLTDELYVLERRPGARLEQASSLGSRVVSEDCRSRPVVTIASERMDEDPSWRPFACGAPGRYSASARSTIAAPSTPRGRSPNARTALAEARGAERVRRPRAARCAGAGWPAARAPCPRRRGGRSTAPARDHPPAPPAPRARAQVRVEVRIGAGGQLALGQERRRSLRFAGQRAQHVERDHVARALPHRADLDVAVELRHRRLLDVAVAAQALERLGRQRGAALADPVLHDRQREAPEGGLLGSSESKARAIRMTEAVSPPRTRARCRRAR